MLNSTILDISAVAVIIFSGLNGARKGIILSISGIIGIVAAFFGAGYLTDQLTPLLSEYVVAPKIREWLSADENLTSLTNAARAAREALDKAAEAIRALLAGIGVPNFISGPLAEDIAKNAEPDTILNTAVSAISGRLSGLVIYSVSFLLILVAIAVFARVLNRIIDFTPVGVLNRFGGLIFGTVLGVVVIFVVMAVIPKVAPSLAADGMFFSPETANNSFVMRKLQLLFDTVRDKI